LAGIQPFAIMPFLPKNTPNKSKRGYQLKTGQNAELAAAYLYHDPMTKKQNNPEYTRSQQSYRH